MRRSSRVEIISADLTATDAIAQIARLLQEDHRIDVLVNNAGVVAASTLLESDADAMSAMIQLHVNALMRQTYAAVPRFFGAHAEHSTHTTVTVISGIRFTSR